MQPFAAAYYDRFEKLHTALEETLNDLPQDALDWNPGPDMNSITVLAAHIAGAERYWVGDVAMGEPSGRDRPAEFTTWGTDAATLIQRLAGVLEYVRSTCERLTLDDLERVRTSPRDGQQFTVAWCLNHALEHTALHTGHMQITRQLWEQQTK